MSENKQVGMTTEQFKELRKETRGSIKNYLVELGKEIPTGLSLQENELVELHRDAEKDRIESRIFNIIKHRILQEFLYFSINYSYNNPLPLSQVRDMVSLFCTAYNYDTVIVRGFIREDTLAEKTMEFIALPLAGAKSIPTIREIVHSLWEAQGN